MEVVGQLVRLFWWYLRPLVKWFLRQTTRHTVPPTVHHTAKSNFNLTKFRYQISSYIPDLGSTYRVMNSDISYR
jgi:hypothetical protein